MKKIQSTSHDKQEQKQWGMILPTVLLPVFFFLGYVAKAYVDTTPTDDTNHDGRIGIGNTQVDGQVLSTRETTDETTPSGSMSPTPYPTLMILPTQMPIEPSPGSSTY